MGKGGGCKVPRRPSRKKKSSHLKSSSHSGKRFLSFNTDKGYGKSEVEKLTESLGKAEERLQDIEIHLNLLTRLFTTVWVEKFGMRIGVLKRLIKRIETEAIRDSQIMHLESLYKLPHQPEKKSPSSPPPSKNDPWEEIS